jgi:membrane protease YdiL (CAAX protease family)
MTNNLKFLYLIFKEQIKYLIVCIYIYFLCSLITLPFGGYFKFDLRYGSEFSIISLIAASLFCISIIYFYQLRFYKKKIKYDIIVIFISFLTPIVITLLISVFDQSTIKYNYFNTDIIYLFISFLLFAFLEEVVFRGVLLKDYLNESGQKYAIFISSLFFSLAHIGNNSFGVIPFTIIFISGLILSEIYIYSSLFTVSIVHALWNISSSVIIGGYVSGFKVKYSLFNYYHTNNNIINGGKFGIEGSVITLILLALIYLLMIYIKKDSNGRIEISSSS